MFSVFSALRGATLLLVVGLTLPSVAAEITALPCAPADIQLVEEANWPPFTLEPAGLASRGLSFDLMQLIFSRMDRCASIILLPQLRVFKQLNTLQADGVTLARLAPERSEYLAYTATPLVTLRGYLYFRADWPAGKVFTNWEDVRGLRLGVVRGRYYPEEFTQAREQGVFTTVEVVNSTQLVGMLIRGRIDAIPFLEIEAKQILALPEFRGKVKPAPQIPVNMDFYLALTRKPAMLKLLPQVNQTIDELQASGELQALLSRYGL